MKEESGMNFLEHAEELRKRIIYSVIPVLVFFVPCYIFSKQLFDLLMGPIIRSLPEGSSLIFTRPAEGFLTYLKVSLFFSPSSSRFRLFSITPGILSPRRFTRRKKGSSSRLLRSEPCFSSWARSSAISSPPPRDCGSCSENTRPST